VIIRKSNYRKLPTALSALYTFCFLSWELLYDKLLFKQHLKSSKKRQPVLLGRDPSCCVDCQLCVELCPDFALSFDKDHLILDQMSCSFCEYCKTVCPTHQLDLREVPFSYLSEKQRFFNLTAASEDGESGS
jgi:ferredoxin